MNKWADLVRPFFLLLEHLFRILLSGHGFLPVILFIVMRVNLGKALVLVGRAVEALL
jgi:hypothetical protein